MGAKAKQLSPLFIPFRFLSLLVISVSLVPVTRLSPLNSFNPLINPSPYKFTVNKTKDILTFVDCIEY